MKKRLLFFLILISSHLSYAQLACPILTSPVNGENNISVDATINWNGIVGAPAYLISIGTTPNGTDILNNQNIGNATSYKPPLGFPENTNIYITITIFFFNAENIVCESEMFQTENVVSPPSCTSPIFPVNGASNVNVATAISWRHTSTATGYRLSLGTTPGGTDLLNNENVVDALRYQPNTAFEVETHIYATIIPYNENGVAVDQCSEYSFTTGVLVTVPDCTSLVNPVNGAINVELSPVIEWAAVPNASGYYVTIGTTPFDGNVLDNVPFTQNRTLVVDFKPNLTFFVTIIPFNSAGEALNCIQESFSTILGCGPYYDSTTDQLVDLRPEINIPDTISICKNELPYQFTSNDNAEGFRWYKLDQNDTKTLVSSTNEIELIETGRYRYEAYNTINQSGFTITCENSKIIEVTASEIAIIDALNVTGQNATINVSVQVSGNGAYEYAVDSIDGLYKESADFQNLEPGFHTFYVRDINGCGIAQKKLEQDLTLEGFPKFFTPNGDGVNDFWQFVIPPEITNISEILQGDIFIFDRYGSFLLQLDPTSSGWNGSFNGTPLPATDYWFKAISSNLNEIKGHFTLKR